MKKLIIIIALFLIGQKNYGQLGYGVVVYNDFYTRIINKSDNIANASSGSAVLNLGIGPKLWIGGKNISISVESSVNVGLLGLSTKDYKGLGMVNFPIMTKLNFLGSSSFSKSGKVGFSIGGGIQYNKTELYYLSKKFKDKGVERNLFKTYVMEVASGFGINGVVINLFFRYGYHPDNDAKTYNMGMFYDFNFNSLKKIVRPESQLL